MGGKLTQKQRGFVDLIAEGKTQSDAYRSAYDAENMTSKQIWEEASVLAANPKVSRRLFLLQEAAQERTLVSIESLTKELEEARKVSKAEKQGAAMTGASMGKAKLHGLLVDKAETKLEVKHDFDGASEKLSALLTARDARK